MHQTHEHARTTRLRVPRSWRSPLGLYRSNQRKAAHKANFWGMFVLPDCRGQGVAVRLLDAAIRYARTLDGVTSVHLSVSESAVAAQHLYEKAGFQTWG